MKRLEKIFSADSKIKKMLLQKKESAVWLGVRKGTLRGQKNEKEFTERKIPGLPGYSLYQWLQ